jgi:hypothetical protein
MTIDPDYSDADRAIRSFFASRGLSLSDAAHESLCFVVRGLLDAERKKHGEPLNEQLNAHRLELCDTVDRLTAELAAANAADEAHRKGWEIVTQALADSQAALAQAGAERDETVRLLRYAYPRVASVYHDETPYADVVPFLAKLDSKAKEKT